MVTTRLLQDYVRLMIEAIRTKKGVKSKMGEKFSLQKFKSLPNSEIMIQYANQYLDKLGEGSSRIAFLLSSKYVLKVALNKKGLAQNKAELEVFTNPTSKNVVAKIYGSDDASQWVIADLVRPVKSPEEFEQLSGQDWEDFVKYVGPAIKEPERVPDSHKWLKAVAITARENNLLRGDLEEIDHWGRTPDGRCVLSWSSAPGHSPDGQEWTSVHWIGPDGGKPHSSHNAADSASCGFALFLPVVFIV